MKKFEFRLSRVLEYREEEAGLERTRLGALRSQEKTIEDEKNFLQNQLIEARDEAIGDSALQGSTLQTLAQFKRYVTERTMQLDQTKADLQLKINEQRLRVLEADRRVNLLLKLKGRKQQAWTHEQDKELEALAADSYTAKLAARRRLTDRLDTTAQIELNPADSDLGSRGLTPF